MIVCIQDNQMIIKQRKKKTMNNENTLTQYDEMEWTEIVALMKSNTAGYGIFEQHTIEVISRLNNVVISTAKIFTTINDYLIDLHDKHGDEFIDAFDPQHTKNIVELYLTKTSQMPAPLVFGGEDCDEDCIECQG
jgi:hypothetical protein